MVVWVLVELHIVAQELTLWRLLPIFAQVPHRGRRRHGHHCRLLAALELFANEGQIGRTRRVGDVIVASVAYNLKCNVVCGQTCDNTSKG